MTSDEFNLMMAEIGPLDDEIDEVVRTGDDRWEVRLGEVAIEVEHEPAGRRAAFATTIGTPSPLRELEVFRALLSATMLWRDTGGVKYGLGGIGGEAVQMVEIAAPDLRPDVIATVVVNLAARALIWRGFIAEDVVDVPPPPADDIQFSSYIRV